MARYYTQLIAAIPGLYNQTALTNNLFSVDCIDKDNGWAVGSKGTILKISTIPADTRSNNNI